MYLGRVLCTGVSIKGRLKELCLAREVAVTVVDEPDASCVFVITLLLASSLCGPKVAGDIVCQHQHLKGSRGVWHGRCGARPQSERA